MRRLIVNADDFGRAPGVSRGIVEAHREGIVTSTTLMVNLPWSRDASDLAARTPTLGVGLHLSFCYGESLASDAPSLLGDDGLLERDLDRLRGRLLVEDVEREARAQLERFRKLSGRNPTHLDSHQHVHTWPEVYDTIGQIAQENDLPLRAIEPGHRDRLRQLGVRTTDHFAGQFFAPGSMTADLLLDALASLPDGTIELMCHPGIDDEHLADSSFRRQREAELRLLCRADVRQALAGVELITYGEL